MRFAPSIDIVDKLLKEGAQLFLYDPQAMREAGDIFSRLEGKKKRLHFSGSPYEAVKNCDCVCFLTEWEEFKNLDFKRIKKVMRHLAIADGRNMFDKNKLIKLGFHYIGVGR